MERKILVLGGTGKTGKRVIEKLEELKISSRLGSRNAPLPFDWGNPENWTAVLNDIQQVYITFQPDLAVPDALEKIQLFIDTAQKVGVQNLVLLSGRGEKEAQKCEDAVMNSGLSWTIVRSSWFMQNFSESFFLDAILNGHLTVPQINALEPFVDTDDIADVVVSALIDDEHSGKIYELTGPELMSFKDAAATISKAIDKPITYQEVEIDEYVNILRKHHTPEDFIWLIKYLFTQALDGRNESVTNDIKKVLGREPITFSQYVVKTKQTGVWGI